VHEEREPAAEKPDREDDHKKEKSVLQAKLTKLAIQIGYAGKLRGIFLSGNYWNRFPFGI
jgi:hypothetical protein